MIASGKSTLSLICSVAGGILNIVLDYLFIACFHMGISGAATATGLGYSVTAVAGLFLFSQKKNLLHFKKPVFRLKVLANAAANGCSEMASALVTGIITMVFNWTMLHYVGEDGVAAVTIIMYVLMAASSLYTGYSCPSLPLPPTRYITWLSQATESVQLPCCSSASTFLPAECLRHYQMDLSRQFWHFPDHLYLCSLP